MADCLRGSIAAVALSTLVAVPAQVRTPQAGTAQGGTKNDRVYTHEITHVVQQKIRVLVPDLRATGDKTPLQASIRFLDPAGVVLDEQKSSTPSDGMFVFEFAPDQRRLRPGTIITVRVTVPQVAKVDALTMKMKVTDDKVDGSVELVDTRTGNVVSRRRMPPRKD